MRRSQVGWAPRAYQRLAMQRLLRSESSVGTKCPPYDCSKWPTYPCEWAHQAHRADLTYAQPTVIWRCRIRSFFAGWNEASNFSVKAAAGPTVTNPYA